VKLTRLALEDFAQLDRVDIRFRDDRPNLISGPNETGKSHIMQALYGIIFGLESPERFHPWSKPLATPRGVLEFETDAGHSVRLDRMFETQQVDVTRNGEQTWSAAFGPGTRVEDAEYYFECLHEWLGFSQADVFTATTFVQQTDLVRANLQGLAPQIKGLMTGARETDYERALTDMREGLDALRMPPRTGNPRFLERKEQELAELAGQLSDARVHQDSVLRLQERRMRLQEEVAEVIMTRDASTARLERMETAVERRREAAELRARRDQMRTLLDQFMSAHGAVEQAEIERDTFAAAGRIDLMALLDLDHAVQQARRELSAAQQQATQRPRWATWMPWAGVVLGVAAGITLALVLHTELLKLDARFTQYFVSPFGLSIVIVIAVFLLLAWGFGLWKDVPRDDPAPVREARARLDEARQKRSQAFEELGVGSVDESITLRQAFEGANNKLERARSALEALGDEDEVRRSWERVKKQISEAGEPLEEVSETEVISPSVAGVDAQEEEGGSLRRRIAGLDRRLAALQQDEAAIERDLLVHDGRERDVPVLVEQVTCVRAEIAKARSRVRSLTLAVDTLERAAEDFHEHILDPVVDDASALLHALTGGRYTRVRLDHEHLDPAVDTQDKVEIASQSLSRGVQDQLYFALRVALSTALSGGRRLPLILDDPYVNLDPTRLHKTIVLLHSLAERTQIILFSCNTYYEQWFDPVLRLHRGRPLPFTSDP